MFCKLGRRPAASCVLASPEVQECCADACTASPTRASPAVCEYTYKPISDLQSITSHMGWHNVTRHPTQVNVPTITPAKQASPWWTYPGRMECWLKSNVPWLPCIFSATRSCYLPTVVSHLVVVVGLCTDDLKDF